MSRVIQDEILNAPNQCTKQSANLPTVSRTTSGQAQLSRSLSAKSGEDRSITKTCEGSGSMLIKSRSVSQRDGKGKVGDENGTRRGTTHSEYALLCEYVLRESTI